MNLCYTLPDQEAALLKPLREGQPIRYCVPYDLDDDGAFCGDGWIAVTERVLFILKNGTLKHCVPLAETDEVVCTSQVDCGILAARRDGRDQYLCRFSMRHMIRVSYTARGATLFCKGDNRPVESREREKTCPQCGKALPGTSECPHCAGGRGRTFRRFWDLCSGYTLPLMLLTGIMALMSGISIAQQYIQRRFIDDVLVPAKGGLGEVGAFFAVMLVIVLFSLALWIINAVWSNSLGTRISRDLRARTFYKINALSMSFINSRQTGELMNRVVEDAARIREFMEQVFAQMFSQIFIMAGALIAMFVMNWKLALLGLFFAPVGMVLIRAFRRYEHRLWRQRWRTEDKVNDRLQDVISGIRVVKSFGQEQRESERFRAYAGRLMKITRRNEVFWATLYAAVTFFLTSGTLLVIYFGGGDVLRGRMTPGELVQFIAYTNMLYGPLQFVSRLPRMLMRLNTAMERIYDILDEEPQFAGAADSVDRPLEGTVEFDNVSFGYKSYEPVLEHIGLRVEKGEMIGLVGSSGAGKSTVINLLMRLYEVDDGEIRIDGVPLPDLAPECLHRQIGVVLQETFLFSGTVFDNIRFARPDAPVREIIQAAKMANAHEFITKLPDGYDTYVGERGYTLSGGERQRIAIARAILHDPRLLILDEATSALDTETEYQIQEALGRLTRGRTTFAIAHRLSTLREADRIVVIDKHHIAEVGSHNELMKKKGIYYGLVMAQLEMHKVREESA